MVYGCEYDKTKPSFLGIPESAHRLQYAVSLCIACCGADVYCEDIFNIQRQRMEQSRWQKEWCPMTRAELTAENLEFRAALRTIYDEIAALLNLETCEDQDAIETDDDERGA